MTDSIPSRWSATLPLFGLWKGYPSLNKCLYRVSGLPNYCIWPDSMESSLYSIEIQSLSPQIPISVGDTSARNTP